MPISRRAFLYFVSIGGALLFSPRSFAADAVGGKMLILYFSHTNHTRTVAQFIQQATGADLVEVKTVQPYPDDYNTLTDIAKKEQQSHARPEISTAIPNFDQYQVVFIGTPNWCGTMPMAMFTMLEKYDFSKKTIAPFCTHEGSRLGRIPSDIKKLSHSTKVLEGLAVQGTQAKNAQSNVNAWLRQIGLTK